MSEHTPNENQLTRPVEENNSGRRAMLAGIGGLAAGALLTGRAQAGPLDPPPGPIASTGKPLTELEPRIAINATNTPGDAESLFRITEPGSYYLTGSIAVPAGKHGITVAAPGVSIDLNGFQIRGTGASHGNFDGVNRTVLEIGTAVKNGHIEAMGGSGIILVEALVENIIVTQCLDRGIQAGGRVIGCITVNNGGSGIDAFPSTVVQYCQSQGNGGHGILSDGRCVVEGCTTSFNGIDGIHTGPGCIVTDCTSANNAADGIKLQAGSAIDCVAIENQGNGIRAESGSSVTHCRTSFSEGFGVLATFAGVVSDCLCSSNTTGGISAVSDAHLCGNTCHQNGGAGIVINGSDNRIEGNHCSDNPIGLLVSSGGNIIIRNTCAGNTILNWSLSVNNYYGPIINRSGAGTAAVSGNNAAGTLASTDPHANFTY